MKNLSGINAADGYLVGLNVTGDGTITGNLTVSRTIEGGSIVSDTNFLASDTTDQYKVSSTNFDLKSNTTSPVFRLKNSSGITTNSTLQCGPISASTGTFTGTMSTGAFVNFIDSTDTSTSVVLLRFQNLHQANDGVIFKNGPSRTPGDGNPNDMTVRNDAGSLRLMSQTTNLTLTPSAATLNAGLTVTSLTSTTLSNTSTATITGYLTTLGGVGINDNTDTTSSVAIIRLHNLNQASDGLIFKNGPNRTGDGGVNTMTIRNDAGLLRLISNTCTLQIQTNSSIDGNFLVSRTTQATSSADGALTTYGGIKAYKTVVANQGVRIPYGQAILSDDTLVVQTKMMDAQFNLTGGVSGDGLYLYTPGSTGGSASTSYVLGLNAGQAKFPQNVAIAGNLTVTGSITGGSISYASTSTGTLAVTTGTGTTLTVSSTDANSVTLAGGINIAGNCVVSGTLTAGTIAYASTSTGTMAVTNVSGTTLTVASTTNSSTPSNGCATFAGGIGVTSDIHIGGDCHIGQTNPTNGQRNFTVFNTSTNAGSTGRLNFTNSATTAYLSYQSTTAAEPSSFILNNTNGLIRLTGQGGNGMAIDSTYVYSDKIFWAQNTTDSSGTTSGGTIVEGGLAVKRKSYFGDDMHPTKKVIIEDATQSTSSTTGCLQTAGGAGIAGNVNIGGTLGVTGNVTARNYQTSGTSQTDPGVTFYNVNTNSNTNMFLKSNITSGYQADLMLGNSITSMGCVDIGYKYNSNSALTEAKFGFYGQDGLICRVGDGGANPGGLSILNSPFFSYDEGTFNVSDANGATITGQNSKYVRIGRIFTCTLNITFTSTGNILLLSGLFPLTPVAQPAILLNAAESELGGVSKPYYLQPYLLDTTKYSVCGFSSTGGLTPTINYVYPNGVYTNQILKATYSYTI